MKKNKNTKVEAETKVIEQPKVETVVETQKKKRKHYRKPKVKVQEQVTSEPIVQTNEVKESIAEQVVESKPTLIEWIAAIRYGWRTIPGFFNKIRWTYNLIKLNK